MKNRNRIHHKKGLKTLGLLAFASVLITTYFYVCTVLFKNSDYQETKNIQDIAFVILEIITIVSLVKISNYYFDGSTQSTKVSNFLTKTILIGVFSVSILALYGVAFLIVFFFVSIFISAIAS